MSVVDSRLLRSYHTQEITRRGIRRRKQSGEQKEASGRHGDHRAESGEGETEQTNGRRTKDKGKQMLPLFSSTLVLSLNVLFVAAVERPPVNYAWPAFAAIACLPAQQSHCVAPALSVSVGYPLMPVIICNSFDSFPPAFCLTVGAAIADGGVQMRNS